MATLATETWAGTSGAAWPSQWTRLGSTGATPTVDGANHGLLSTTTTGYAIGATEYLTGMTASVNQELYVDLTVNLVAEAYHCISIRADSTLRGSDVMAANCYYAVMQPGGGTIEIGSSTSAAKVILAEPTFTFAANTRYGVRFRAVDGVVSFRIWNLSGAEPGTWLWSGSNSAVTGAGKVMLTAANGGVASVKTLSFGNLTATDGVTGPVAPTASFTGPTATATGTAATFTDTSTGTPTSWAWTFGDSTTSSAQNPSKTWATAGSFTVGLTATNAQGSSSTSQTVTVLAPGQWDRTTWNTALAAGTATWMAVGDSITEGQGASARVNRWIEKTAALIATAKSVPVTGVYLPAWYATYSPTTWTPYTATSGTVTNSSAYGNPGNRTASLGASGSRTFSVTGTSVDIWYYLGTTSNTFSYRIDGGTAVTVNATGTFSPTPSKVTVSLGASGTHTVVITRLTGTPLFIGVDGNNGPGLTLFDGGHTGYVANQYVSTLTQWQAFNAAVAPDLATIALGMNEYLNNPRTPAQYKTDMQTLITSLRSQTKKPSIMLVIYYAPAPGQQAAGQTATFDNYAQQLLDIATADPTVGVTDLRLNMPQATTSGTGYYNADGIHPNDSGHTQIASLMQATLAPPTTVTVTDSQTTTWAVLATTAATRASAWAVRVPVTTTRATNWAARSTVTASRNSAWQVGATVSTSRTTSWTVTTSLTASRSCTWVVAAAVGSTKATAWTVARSVAAARTMPWSVNSAVTVARSTGWAANSPVGVTRATAWTATRTVASSRATGWLVDALSGVAASRSSAWVVRVAVATARATAWQATTMAATSRATSWSVLTPAATSRATAWGVSQAVAVTRSATWAAAQAIAASRATTWNLDAIGSVGASKATAWAVAARITATRATAWTVTTTTQTSRGTSWTTTTPVTTTRATTWGVRTGITASRVSTWAAQQTVGTARAATWLVDSIGSVAASRSTAWTVTAQATTSRQTGWNVAGTVSTVAATRTTQWVTRTAVQPVRGTTWGTYTTTAATRASGWAVNVAAATTRQTAWATRTAVSANRATGWVVCAAVSGNISAVWAVTDTQTVVVTRTANWTIIARITVSRLTRWRITVLIAEHTYRPTNDWTPRPLETVTYRP